MAISMISSKNFWFSTFGLLLIWIVVLTTAVVSPSMKVNEKNCKALCQHCGCMGFYCGEECICECNDEKSDTECINVMQTNARKLDIPFQLMIQGPSSNRFVRNALIYDQGAAAINAPSSLSSLQANQHRQRRSTIVIYKPANQNALDFGADQRKLSKDPGALRHKRSVGKQLDWFSDLTSTLVRPAPLSLAKKPKPADPTPSQHKRATSKDAMDRSWFAEDANFVLRPAPLFKRQRNRANDDEDNDNSDLPKLPRVFKDTLRSIQESTIGADTAGDLGDNLLSTIKESTNVLQSQLGDNNLQFLPGSGVLRDTFQQTLSNLHSQIFNAGGEDEERVAQPPPPVLITRRKAAPKEAVRPRFTWFRPVRFLQRVQQAIN